MLHKKNQTGFTLIELVMTIVIISILAAIVYARYVNLSQSAKTATCKANQMTLETAQRLYYSRNVVNGIPQYANNINDLLPLLSTSFMPACPEDSGQLELLPEGLVTCVLPEHKRN